MKQTKSNQDKPNLIIKESFIWYMLFQDHCRSFRKSVNHRSNNLFLFKCGASPAKPSAQVQSPVAPLGESHNRKMEGWKLDHFRFGARVSVQRAILLVFGSVSWGSSEKKNPTWRVNDDVILSHEMKVVDWKWGEGNRHWLEYIWNKPIGVREG